MFRRRWAVCRDIASSIVFTARSGTSRQHRVDGRLDRRQHVVRVAARANHRSRLDFLTDGDAIGPIAELHDREQQALFELAEGF
jgi:hypothetical protein